MNTSQPNSPLAGCFQVDWLHRPLLHGGPGPGLQLPGPAVRHSGIRQARLPDDAGLHLQHWRNHAHGVSLSVAFLPLHSAAAAPNCGECESIRACFPQWRRIQLHLLLGADGGGDHRLSGGRKHGEDFL